MKKTNDIFVSYAHVDNKPYSNESDGWINRLLQDLKIELNRLFGRPDAYTIWKDDLLRGNQSLSSQIKNELDQAKILLVFYSKGYQSSKWCQDELEYFTQRVGKNSEQVFFIVQDDTPLPESYSDYLNYHFWEYSEKQVVYRLGSYSPSNPEHDYQLRRGDVASELQIKITSLEQPKNQPKISQPNRTIYLAQVSKNLISQREALIRELEQHDYQVIPKQHILSIDEEAQELKNCICFVQLLEQNTNRGFPVDLHNIALDSGKPILQWRSDNLSINEIEDKPHRQLLLNETVIASPMVNFQQELLKFLQPKPETKPNKKQHKTIFIHIDNAMQDYAIAKKVYNKLSTMDNYACILPLDCPEASPEEIRKDREQNLQLCDIVLLIYKSTPNTKIRGLLYDCIRINAKRETPLKTAICLNGNQVPINIVLPDMHELSCTNNFEEHCLQKLLNEVVR